MQLRYVAWLAIGAALPSAALIRFGCSQLTVTRLDPLVNPGVNPSPHLHQIVGGVREPYKLLTSIAWVSANIIAMSTLIVLTELVQCIHGPSHP